ncbi:DNA-binding transcriptional MerR regulator [Pontibacter aydingkolensis]|uniref:MerR family transcriptional regulator n=1 Tax=Pontibacter aydingkolensis TaxID=1911536 RepID=A0ABS7CW97_9BACT|nr:MerR family transcriptional regulator [Pontibacter aydingkolensis]MBW7468099.1 MerR family transcriptional regulator [Pontibacter aydingkolensis]
MAQYTIKELEHLSGIKAHTIRIWEQRYSILSPKRTETNIRYYDDADLKSILNISLLNERGYKISKIAQMPPEQIMQKVQQLCEESCRGSHHISTLVKAMVDMDEEAFDKTLSTAALQLGLKETMSEVIYPFLTKIGILWQTGNITPAHEHFVSNLIRQKLIVAIDGQVVRAPEDAPVYILYLPEGELHELVLLYVNYLLRSSNKKVVYLGQNLPFTDLELTYRQFNTKYIFTVLTATPERDQVQGYINKMAATFPECIVYMYGHQLQNTNLTFPESIKKIGSPEELLTLFR